MEILFKFYNIMNKLIIIKNLKFIKELFNAFNKHFGVLPKKSYSCQIFVRIATFKLKRTNFIIKLLLFLDLHTYI